jgi:hypothetical protein
MVDGRYSPMFHARSIITSSLPVTDTVSEYNPARAINGILVYNNNTQKQIETTNHAIPKHESKKRASTGDIDIISTDASEDEESFEAYKPITTRYRLLSERQ